MKVGADRIRDLVLSLRNFSRLDEAEMKSVNIHEGIDSTLLILQNQLKAKANRPEIQIIKEYGNLPLVECHAGQLNQVFMNIISNAIDVLTMGRSSGLANGQDASQSPIPTIRIRTEVQGENQVAIRITDNGTGMTQQVCQQLFNPFFTTKPVGKGTGLGLSISYQIVVEKHSGQLRCISAPGKGAEFAIEIPIWQSDHSRLFAIASPSS
jgi:signal transduction histidine kinase